MKRTRTVYAVAALAALALGLVLANNAAAWSVFSKYETVKAENGVVAIPVADVADGEAHYFQFEHQGKQIKFFVLKSKDGVLRAAFDACDVCWREGKGYEQQGDFMVCLNCGQRFHSTRINVVKGGCNPAPLRRVYDMQTLTIAAGDLRDGLPYFNI